jgi:hypothetical protein
MIEIISIFIHLLVITIFCYPSKILANFFHKEEKNFMQTLEIGIVINIFLLLTLSLFYRKDLSTILYFASFLFLFNLYHFIRDLIKSIKIKKIIISKEFIILFLLVFIFSINLSNNLKIGWDAQNYWLVKKLVFTNGGDIFDLQYTPMKSYPYLGSFLWFFYSKISITGLEYFGRIFYIFLFLVSIFATLDICNADFTKKFLLTITSIFLIYNFNLFNGYQEVLIFSLTAILTKTFYKYLNFYKKFSYSKGYFCFVAIICLNIILIKNDGLAIVLVFLFSLWFTKITIKEKLNYLLIIFFVFFFKYLLFNYINLNNVLQEDNYKNITILKLFEFFNIQRLFLIFQYFFFALLDNIIFLIGIFFLIILLKFNKNNKFILFLMFCYLFSILFMFTAFFLTSYPIEFALKTAIFRVLFEVSGFFLILIPLFFNFISKK